MNSIHASARGNHRMKHIHTLKPCCDVRAGGRGCDSSKSMLWKHFPCCHTFVFGVSLSLFLSLFLFSGGCDSSKSMFWKYFSCTVEPAINSNSLITGCDKTLQYPLLPQNTTRLGGSHPIMGRTLWLNFIDFDTGCFFLLHWYPLKS